MSDDEGMSIHAGEDDINDIEEPVVSNVSKRGRPRRSTTKAAANRKVTNNRAKPTKRTSQKAKPVTKQRNNTGPSRRFRTPPPPKVLSKVVVVKPPVVQTTDGKLNEVIEQMKTLTTVLTHNALNNQPSTSAYHSKPEINITDSTDESSSDEDESSELGSDVEHRKKSVWDRLGKKKSIKDRLGPRKIRKSDYDVLCDSSYLPPVKKNLLRYLFNESEYVKISDLLEENRIPSANKSKNHGTQVTTDAETGQLVIKAATKGCMVTSFTEFVECFTVLAAYRITVNPRLALPMNNYLNVMAELAHPERGYPLEKWLAYDARIRTMAARKPKDFSLWSTVNSDVKQRTCLTNSNGSSTSREHGHKIQLRVTESFNQPFRTGSATDGEICKRFNRGQCPGEQCPNSFIHACNICKKAGHNRTQCSRYDPNHYTNSRHTAKGLNSTKI